MSKVRSLSHLKAAAALISCSLASAEAAAQLGMPPLQFTTVNSFTITMTAGSAAFTYTKSGPNTGFFYNGHTSSGMSAATHAAAGNTSGYDLFAAFIDPIPSLTIATGTGTASLTFSSDVVFTDVGFMMNGISSGWRYGGAAVNDGDVFRASASPYVFDINYYYFGPVSYTHLTLPTKA